MDKKKIQLMKNLSTGMVIVAMILAFLIAGIRIFGVQAYGVLTGSMEPTYPTGSLIYVKRVDTDDLRVNDVITFSMSTNVIATHRIVEIVPDENNPSVVRYRTKGDANSNVDAALVNPSNVIGKVLFSIPQMGYIANYIQHPPGIYVAILVCGLMVAFVFYTDALESKQKERDRRNAGRSPQRRPQARQNAPQRTNVRQEQYSRQGYPRQSASSRPDEYRRQNSYSRQGEYVRQDGYNRQRSYTREDGYARQSGYPRRSSSSRQNEYPRQRPYSQQSEASHRREYSRDDASRRM